MLHSPSYIGRVVGSASARPVFSALASRSFHISPTVEWICPKERKSKRRKKLRTMQRHMKPVPHLRSCSNCNHTVLLKHVCGKCGFYYDKPFTLKAKAREERRVSRMQSAGAQQSTQKTSIETAEAEL